MNFRSNQPTALSAPVVATSLVRFVANADDPCPQIGMMMTILLMRHRLEMERRKELRAFSARRSIPSPRRERNSASSTLLVAPRSSAGTTVDDVVRHVLIVDNALQEKLYCQQQYNTTSINSFFAMVNCYCTVWTCGRMDNWTTGQQEMLPNDENDDVDTHIQKFERAG